VASGYLGYLPFLINILFALIDSVDQDSKKKIDLDQKTLSDRDLNIRQYTLPEGHLLVKFKLTVKDESSSRQQFSSNRYMVCTICS